MSLKTENSRRVAKSRPVCMGLKFFSPKFPNVCVEGGGAKICFEEAGPTQFYRSIYRPFLINFADDNRQFQLLVYACRGGGGWEVRYHIADYSEKIKMVAV